MNKMSYLKLKKLFSDMFSDLLCWQVMREMCFRAVFGVDNNYVVENQVALERQASHSALSLLAHSVNSGCTIIMIISALCH